MIKAAHLSKHYRQKVAVDDISFEVPVGKVTGFLGPNGAGKSTTMRLMLGLDNGGGHTTFDGKKLFEYAQPSKVVGILLEAKAFHPTRTARHHLQVLADAGQIKGARIDEALELVGLTEVANKKPGKFSLGMSQRLGIAAAILGHPKYLLLDEPANGLDPEGIHWLRQFIKDYADAGNAVFISSHLLSEMSQMADNLVVIGKGKLISSGTVQGFIDLAKGTGISVRVPSQETAAFEKVLQTAKLKFDKSGGSFKVYDVKTDKVGKLAFDSKLTVLELAPQTVSLEDAFLEVTADSQEYSTSTEPKKGKK